MRRFPKYLLSDNKKRNLIYCSLALTLLLIGFFSSIGSVWHLMLYGERVTMTIVEVNRSLAENEYVGAYTLNGEEYQINFDVSNTGRLNVRPSYVLNQEVSILTSSKYPEAGIWTQSITGTLVLSGLLLFLSISLFYYIVFSKRKVINWNYY